MSGERLLRSRRVLGGSWALPGVGVGVPPHLLFLSACLAELG